MVYPGKGWGRGGELSRNEVRFNGLRREKTNHGEEEEGEARRGR